MALKSAYLKSFISEIKYRNRNPKDTKALALLDDIITNPEYTLYEGDKLYRCRIIREDSAINKEVNFYGFDAKGSFVPPAKSARDLRANYRYIPYLYASNNPYISLVEVRPRLGARVSIATIEVQETIRLLDFTNHTRLSKMPESKINLFSDLSTLFSKPVTDEDDIIDYIPTQYIAEYAKNLGYDGIMFKSSLVPEMNRNNLERYNVVVFNYWKCTPLKSNVISVAENYYEFDQIDQDIQKLNVKSYWGEQIHDLAQRAKALIR